MQYESQVLECNGILRTEYRYVPDLEDRVSGAEIINAASNPKGASRYLVTLANRYSGEEKLLDVLIDTPGFTSLIQEVRKHYGYTWEFFEWIDTAEPF